STLGNPQSTAPSWSSCATTRTLRGRGPTAAERRPQLPERSPRPTLANRKLARPPRELTPGISRASSASSAGTLATRTFILPSSPAAKSAGVSESRATTTEKELAQKSWNGTRSLSGVAPGPLPLSRTSGRGTGSALPGGRRPAQPHPHKARMGHPEGIKVAEERVPAGSYLTKAIKAGPVPATPRRRAQHL